jgi:hypothetical protein
MRPNRRCGLGYAAERYVGHCESPTLDGFPYANGDEGGSVAVEVVAGLWLVTLRVL